MLRQMFGKKVVMMAYGLLCVGLSWTWAGCSSGGGVEDASQAATISAAMVDASSSVQSEVTVQINQWRATVNQNPKPTHAWVTGTLQEFQVKGTVTNPKGGGTAEVSGQGSYATQDLSVSMQMTLTDWVHGSLTISGTITSTVELKTSGGVGGTSSKTSVKGALLVKGLNSRLPNVAVPVTIQIDVQTSGASVTVCGQVGAYTVGVGKCS